MAARSLLLIVLFSALCTRCANETSDTVNLPDGQVKPATDIVAVSFRIQDSYARPLSGAALNLVDSQGQSRAVLSDAQGMVSLRLAHGQQYSLIPRDTADRRLELSVEPNGRVDVLSARKIYATAMQSQSAASADGAGHYQNARFGQSTFAP